MSVLVVACLAAAGFVAGCRQASAPPEKPEDAAVAPASAKPDAEVTKPAVEVPKPAAETPKPAAEVPKPAAETPKPESPSPTEAAPPKAAAEPPLPQGVTAAPWESLFDGKTLAKWKASDFYKPGAVEVKDGCIVLGRGVGDMTGIAWAGHRDDLPDMGYEIELKAQRVDGSDFFCGLTFPYGKSHCSLVVGGWGGTLVGLSSLNGMDASENETSTWMEFEKKMWYAIRLRVTKNHIEAWIDGEKKVDGVPGDREVGIRIEMEQCVPLGVAAWNTVSAIKDFRLRRLLD
jgi:hypothetical protein